MATSRKGSARKASATATRLVGRDEELATLRDWMAARGRKAARGGQLEVLLVVGTFGVGKSALVAEAIGARSDVALLDAPESGAPNALMELASASRLPAGVIVITRDARPFMSNAQYAIGWSVLEVKPLGLANGEVLFRLAATRAGVSLQLEDAALIRALCARCDGIPHVLEKAALASRALGPKTVFEGLGAGLAVLDTPLEARIARAYAGLGPTERVLLGVAAAIGTSFAASALPEASTEWLRALKHLREGSWLSLELTEGEARFRVFRHLSWVASSSEVDDELLAFAERLSDLADARVRATETRAASEAYAWLLREQTMLANVAVAVAKRGDARSLRAASALAIAAHAAQRADALVELTKLVFQLKDSAHLDPAKQHEIQAICARRARDQLDLDEAIVAMLGALAIAPIAKRIRSLCELAELELGRGAFDDAERWVDEAAAMIEARREAEGEDPVARATRVAVSARERALVLLTRSLVAQARGQLWQAQAFAEQAREHAVQTPSLRTRALKELGTIALARHDLAAARAHYEAALVTCFEPRTLGVIQANLGIALLLDDQVARSIDTLTSAAEQLHRVNEKPFWAQTLGYLGWAQFLGESAEGARITLEASMEGLGVAGDVRTLAVIESVMSVVCARLGRWSESDDNALRARRHAERAQVTSVDEVVRLAHAASALWSARQGRAGLHASLREVADALRRLAGNQSDALNDDVVLGARLIEAAMPSDALFVAADGTWFARGTQSAPTDLSSFSTLSRLLAYLVRKASSSDPSAPSYATSDELLQAGWPGEKVLLEAGKNRLRVAIATLKQHGFDAVSSQRGNGYAIDGNAPLVVDSGEMRALFRRAQRAPAQTKNAL